jgi:hypothetical protein
MTAINLHGQLEVALVVDHPKVTEIDVHKPQGVRLAKLLRDYDQRPSSETWSRIQALAAEILK